MPTRTNLTWGRQCATFKNTFNYVLLRWTMRAKFRISFILIIIIIIIIIITIITIIIITSIILIIIKYKACTLPPIRNDSPELLMMNGGDVIVPVASSPSDEFCHRQGELTFLEESINQLPWWPAWPGKSGLPPYMGWWRNALPCLSQLSAPFSKVKTGQSEKKKDMYIYIYSTVR